MYFKGFISIIFWVILSSCSIVLTDNDPSYLSPQKISEAKTGKVAYNPNGLHEIVRARRNDALRKITEICGSNKYEITEEKTIDAKSADNSIALFGASEIQVISFKCL